MSGFYGKDYDDGGRLLVSAENRNPVDVADDVSAHLLKSNDPPGLFSMGTTAVVLRDSGLLVPLDADGWLAYVSRRVTFRVQFKSGPRIVAPPAAVMKLIPPVVMPELPPLDGVTSTPYLDADGNVIRSDGYHTGTCQVLHTGGLVLPPVSDRPTAGELDSAVRLLTVEWLGDFPFGHEADKANVIAALLTMTGRPFFSLAPLFVLDASTPGSGKGLLASTLALIATGEPPEFRELPADGEEQRKKVTSVLLAGQALIAWDESHTIAGRTLAMILTAERYSDRLLGGNKLISVTNRFTQIALGNNVQVWGDMKRRVVPVRLVPDTDRPEHRTGFRHPDLEQWTRRNRGELLAAALTIWRHWLATGKPRAEVTMGSFEKWARTVGGALAAAGIDGFLSHTDDWLDGSDQDAGEWQEHLQALRRTWGTEEFTAHQVAQATGIELPWFKRDQDMPLAKALGYRYRAIRDRWLGDLRLESPGRTDGRTRWRVVKRDDAPSQNAPNMSTDRPISTLNRDETGISSRDSDISRDEKHAGVRACTVCGEPIAPTLVEAGYTAHDTCEPPAVDDPAELARLESGHQRRLGNLAAMTDLPEEIHVTGRRVKVTGGWVHGRVPDGAVYVGRAAPNLPASPYANPFKVGPKHYGLDESLALYREHLAAHPELVAAARQELAGRDLACWCKPDDPCHADTLIEIANG